MNRSIPHLGLLGLLLAFGVAPGSHAFPPAPHHLLYGVVRDEYGKPLKASGTRVVFETSAGVRYGAAVATGVYSGRNYRLEIPMDAGATADLYRASALRPAAGFRLRVLVGGRTYLPIEMRGDFSLLGQPGEETRLDLTLGEDADGDGLPDAWERALARRLGLDPASIQPEEDPDGNGLTNREEYLAATYAYDPANGFTLAIERGPGGVRQLVFTAVPGRNYLIESSPDLARWQSVEFRLAGSSPSTAWKRAHTVESVQPIRAEVSSGVLESPPAFFRLRVE